MLNTHVPACIGRTTSCTPNILLLISLYVKILIIQHINAPMPKTTAIIVLRMFTVLIFLLLFLVIRQSRLYPVKIS